MCARFSGHTHVPQEVVVWAERSPDPTRLDNQLESFGSIKMAHSQEGKLLIGLLLQFFVSLGLLELQDTMPFLCNFAVPITGAGRGHLLISLVRAEKMHH